MIIDLTKTTSERLIDKISTEKLSDETIKEVLTNGFSNPWITYAPPTMYITDGTKTFTTGSTVNFATVSVLGNTVSNLMKVNFFLSSDNSTSNGF